MFRVRLGFALMGAGLIAAVIAAVMTTEKHFVGVAMSFSVGVLLILGGAMLIALTGTPEEREQRQAQMDRFGAALGMALGRASGGWTPRRHDRKPPQRRNRAE